MQGDGAQASFQIALFRYANRRPLIAIAWGGYMTPDYTTLSFYTESCGEMVQWVGRSFQSGIPRASVRATPDRMTLVFRNARGKVLSQGTWNRSRFVED